MIELNYLLKIGLSIIWFIKLQVSNTCKKVDLFIKEKLYFIYLLLLKLLPSWGFKLNKLQFLIYKNLNLNLAN